MQYWPRLLVTGSTVFSSAISFGSRKPLYPRQPEHSALSILPSRRLPYIPSRDYYLRPSLSKVSSFPLSFCAWQLQNSLCHIYWVLSKSFLCNSWESNSFFSDCHFYESKHIIAYQKISVLDSKKFKAEYNQDFFWFSVVTVLSPFCHLVSFFSTFLKVTLENVVIFINSYF